MTRKSLKATRPSSQPPTRSFGIKLLVGARSITIRLSPLVLVLVALLVFALCATYRQHLHIQRVRQQARVARLRQENAKLHSFIAHQQRETTKMIALAGARSKQLWSQIRARDKQIKQIWKVVGKSPKRVAPKHPRRMSLRGARGGRIYAPQVTLQFHELYQHLHRQKRQLDSLKIAAEHYRKEQERRRRLALLNVTPTLWPCCGPITSPFGYRFHPVYHRILFHTGVDIGVPYGTPIHAAAAGRVELARWLSGYGYTVELNHGHGLETLYAHCSRMVVGKGEVVKKGEVIAYVGATGDATGPHLHYEVRKHNVPVNPVAYLRQKEPHIYLANK